MKKKKKDIFLRPIIKSDINDRYLSWFEDKEVTNFLNSRNLTREKVIEYIEFGINSRTYYLYAVCLVEKDFHIGNVKILID